MLDRWMDLISRSIGICVDMGVLEFDYLVLHQWDFPCWKSPKVCYWSCRLWWCDVTIIIYGNELQLLQSKYFFPLWTSITTCVSSMLCRLTGSLVDYRGDSVTIPRHDLIIVHAAMWYVIIHLSNLSSQRLCSWWSSDLLRCFCTRTSRNLPAVFFLRNHVNFYRPSSRSKHRDTLRSPTAGRIYVDW
jgi:hypothetical protein